jgi:hypothetical protein
MSLTAAGNGKVENRIKGLIDKPKKETLTITEPNIKMVKLKIVGTAPYLQCRFAAKAINKIMTKQQAGSAATKGKRAVHPPRDYDDDFKGACHKMTDGHYGMPATAFRQAAISACRLVNFKGTLAKLSIFVDADGYDEVDATPLVRIDGKPEKHVMMGRNSDMNRTPDVRVRAIYKKWSAVLTVRFDADQFQPADIVNLFKRIGQQVGIGEGRPDSRNSAGMGLGTFDVII